MRKQLRRRPEVEGLEGKTLLSGMTGVSHQVEALAKTPVLPNPLHLTGTLNGTVTQKGKGATVKAAGNLSPVGKVSFNGPAPITLVTGGITNLTIPGKLGTTKISLNLTSAGTTLTGTYTILGGTKALKGETGTGNVRVVLSSLASPVHFTTTFS